MERNEETGYGANGGGECARAAVRRTRMVVLVAIAVGDFAALPPSTWRNVEGMVRGYLDILEDAVGPVA